MKLIIQKCGLKSHRELIITGNLVDLEKVVEKINEERLNYNLDFADFDNFGNDKASAEYIAHKSDHHKAADFIRSVMAQ